MSTVSGSNPEGSTTVFVRNATGLVRELSPFDAFNLVFSAVLIPVGITQVFSFAPTFWPNANVLVSFLLSIPLVLCFGMVYLYFTVAMPRSGGDYVWVSRILGPGVGFITNLSLTFVFTTWISFNFTTMLTLLLPGLGYVAGFTWAPNQLQQFLIATVCTIVFASLMTLGTKRVARYMAYTFAVVWIGMIVWLIGLAVTGHDAFVANFNAHSGTTIAQVTSAASKAGFTAGGALDWAGTIFAMIYAFQVFTGFQWTGYFAGEIKNVRRTATISIIGALIISAVLYVLASLLVYNTYGVSNFASIAYLGFNTSSLSFAPYLPTLVKFLSIPGFLQVFVAACFVLSVLWWTPTGFLIATRNLFAWSFDRLAPEGVAGINERLHTPVIATIIVAVWVEFLNYLNIYQNLGALLLNVIAVMAVAFIMVALAAIVMPYTRRSLFDAAPKMVRALRWYPRYDHCRRHHAIKLGLRALRSFHNHRLRPDRCKTPHRSFCRSHRRSDILHHCTHRARSTGHPAQSSIPGNPTRVEFPRRLRRAEGERSAGWLPQATSPQTFLPLLANCEAVRSQNDIYIA